MWSRPCLAEPLQRDQGPFLLSRCQCHRLGSQGRSVTLCHRQESLGCAAVTNIARSSWLVTTRADLCLRLQSCPLRADGGSGPWLGCRTMGSPPPGASVEPDAGKAHHFSIWCSPSGLLNDMLDNDDDGGENNYPRLRSLRTSFTPDAATVPVCLIPLNPSDGAHRSVGPTSCTS